MKEESKFCCYSDWKKYVNEKYSEYSSKELMDFSRFLNQGIRRSKPDREYWKMCIPIVISFIFTNFIQMIIQASLEIQEADFSNMQFSGIAGYLGVGLLLLVILIICLVYAFYRVLYPLWDSNMEKNLFIDYKEIIEQMMEEKLKKEKKQIKNNDK